MTGRGTVPAGPRPRRPLFVYYRDLSSFVERDWRIISDAYPAARLFCYRGWRDWMRLQGALRSADLVFAWFGGRQALAAAIGKPAALPLVIVAGGYDVARVPDLGYGSFCRLPRALLGRWLFARAARVLAVSEFTAQSARRNARVDPARLRVIHHGFDLMQWAPLQLPRTLDAITITGDDVRRKGLDLVLAAAAQLPDRSFQIIGPVSRAGRRAAGLTPPNVAFTGALPGAEIRRRLASARVYLQPSRHESFGCAVAEAMLMGCVPVVARATAQPEVVGDAGFYLEAFSPAAVVCALESAWAAPESMRRLARARIEREFGLERYRIRLLAELDLLLA